MDLFEYAKEKNLKKGSPLAMRLRPERIEDVVGQEHILGEGKLLRRAIAADKISSLILYGPPGTGKTTLAHVIAKTTKSSFRQLNATTSGKKEMEEVTSFAKGEMAGFGRKTILFIDEIHRFNKAQQDYLLPFVEDGTIILIGATTENPYFEVNSALLSRSTVFECKPLTPEDISVLIDRAVNDEEKGLGSFHAVITDEAKRFLAEASAGDARAALNAVEIGVMTTKRSEDGVIHIDLAVAEECIQRKAVRYDKNGTEHYDTISAFIKSMRGSDPDAAVFYLAKMLEAGEDIKFIARRMMICASEDVGNADPMALVLATSASLAAERVGLPEAHLILAQAATYIASAPKSNASTNAIFEAEECARTVATTVPVHLQDAHYGGHEKLGRGIGYVYPHEYPGHYYDQPYLPEEIRDRKFYRPDGMGDESRQMAHLESIKKGSGDN